MTIMIEAPAAVEAAILEKATRAGLTLPEFALRVLLATELDEARPQEETEKQVDQEAWRQEVMARVRSGDYIRSEQVSSARLIADRREDVRREEEAWREAHREASQT